MMALLEAFDLYRFYHTAEDETRALRGVSLRVEPGEIVAVMGPSGSGKSTLLACLAGLDEPDGGHVELLGHRLSRRPEAERAAMRAIAIGIMLQSGNLFEHLSVEDNLRLQLAARHTPAERRLARNLQPADSRFGGPALGSTSRTWETARLVELLDLVGLSERRHSYPAQLSGGEAARAGLALALAAAPKVLLADEPTGEVDAATEHQLLRLFEARRAAGDGTLVATHSAELAAYADRVLQIRDGRIVNG